MENPIVESDVVTNDGDLFYGVPVIRFPRDLRLEWCHSWKKALIIKFLSKLVGFGLFQHCLLWLWNLKGKSKLIDIGEGFYVVRFEQKDDYMHVLMGGGGAWKLFDHYVDVRR